MPDTFFGMGVTNQLIGTIVNVAAICAGALVGVALKRGIPDRIKDTVVQGLGLAVILIGLKMALETQNPLIVIASLVLGGLVGGILNIDGWINRVGQRLEQLVGGGNGGEIGRAFVASTILFCVGAMAVMGAIEDGLTGRPTTLFAKAMLDGIASVIMASTLGIGVLFSAVPVFIYQGGITLGAVWAAAFISPSVVAELTASGGLVILGIGLNILGVTNIHVANLLPAIFVAPGIVVILERLA
ncbi:membrane protein, putative [Candidatus Desulforudis audaxviator]|nr:membrane protein, putative [Candidatus Desulforudis audaxviator]